MLYYFCLIYILKVYLCVVFWLSMLGNHDRVSSDIYFSSRVFSITGLYYYSMNIHCNTILLSKYSYVSFLWSVYILRFLPNKIVQNYFRVYTMIRSSFYVTFYLIYELLIVKLYNLIALVWRIMITPNWKCLVLVWISNHLLNTK